MIIKKIKVNNMNYGYSSTQKSPLSNYLSKYLSKQCKISSQKNNNNIYNYKHDSKNFPKTFRKEIKEKPIQKYKTTKNSPNHVFKSINHSHEIKEIKENNKINNSIINNNQIFQGNKIKEHLKENNFDDLFMKKIQKIYSKQHSTQNLLSKYSHSYIFKSNSQFENSLKNNQKSYYNNNKLKKSKSNEEEINNPLTPNFENLKYKEEKVNISSDFTQKKKYSFMNSISQGNNNSSKGKKNNNQITLKNYLYSSLSKKQYPEITEKYKLNRSSGTFFHNNSKYNIKQLNKTSYPSKDTSRKDSSEKKNLNDNKKNTSKNFEILNYIISNHKGNINIKPSIISLLKSNNHFSMKNLSEISSKLNNSNTSKLLKPSQGNATDKNFFKMNNIKYLEYIASGLKNNNSTKNTSSLSNKSSKKKEEIEKDYLQMKFQLKFNKNIKSVTTLQSKHNSKSSSKIIDNSNYINNSKINNNNNSIIKEIPISVINSPEININKNQKKNNNGYLSKNNSNQNIKKVNLNVKKEIKNLCNLNKNEKKINNQKIEENKKGSEKEKERNKKIQNNETNQSIQSTMKESSYYRKEMENISNYIKKCKINYIIKNK